MKLNHKILIIDDNFIDQIVTKQLLKKKLNLQDIHVVNSGKEALKWLQHYEKEKDGFLVILLDIKMPEMDGFEFLDEFDNPHNSISIDDFVIVMLSSSLDPNDKKRAQKNTHVKTLLSKPLQAEELSVILLATETKI